MQQAQESLEKFEVLGVKLSTTSNLALLATIQLRLGNYAEAQKYADETIRILEECKGEGPDYPHRDYWSCYNVYRALGKYEAARSALSAAYRLLMNQAQLITNSAMRESYLENISYHRQIINESKQYQ